MVALYCRISEDITGAGLGVGRQEKDCRTLAGLRGWDVEGVYVDNDISAFKRGVVRPEYERLLRDLASGQVSGVVVYDLDRFARQPSDLERAIELFDRNATLHFATVQGDIDLSSPDGRTMARVMVAFANKSSMDTSRRVKRKRLEMAQNGQIAGRRAFGWDGNKLHPVEAPLLRQAARDVMSGIPMSVTVRDWNARGITTSYGGPWTSVSLRKLLNNPRLAGQVRHQGVTLPVRGIWEPLLEQDEWERLSAFLTGRLRPGTGRSITYLLAGLLRCGVCDHAMYGGAQGKTHRYRCPRPVLGGCGKVSISGKHLDAMVLEAVREALAGDHVSVGEWPGREELDAVEKKLLALNAAELDLDVFLAAVAPLQERRRELVAERQGHSVMQLRDTDALEEFDSAELDGKRAIIARHYSYFTVRPARVRRGPFEPERVVPVGF